MGRRDMWALISVVGLIALFLVSIVVGVTVYSVKQMDVDKAALERGYIWRGSQTISSGWDKPNIEIRRMPSTE